MKKISLLTSTLLLSSTILSADITIESGWQLLGATQDMNTSLFNNSCIDKIWKYDISTATPKWKIHVANNLENTQSLNTISSFTKGEGYWVKANGHCVITLAETAATDTHEVIDAHAVSDEVIAEQRATLAASIVGHDVGAQSPRDIDSVTGTNTKVTVTAPAFTEMNLCDIHFHKSAEHKGGEFTEYAGNGDGVGYGSGYKYSGHLTEAETATFHNDGSEVFTNEHNPLHAGDTIEVHYVYTSNAGQSLGNSLGTCLIGENPLLRVEAQVYVVVNDNTTLDFNELNAITGDGTVGNLYQAANIPNNTGTPVHYEGSTTGPGYNEEVSPYQVTWNVRPNIAKVNIATVGEWCHSNKFDEDHAHAVRNLVVNPALLSQIK